MIYKFSHQVYRRFHSRQEYIIECFSNTVEPKALVISGHGAPSRAPSRCQLAYAGKEASTSVGNALLGATRCRVLDVEQLDYLSEFKFGRLQNGLSRSAG